MHTKIQFGKDLKKKIHDKEELAAIGHWAYSVYLNWPDNKDAKFLNLLLHLNTMELGEEFAFTYEELEKIADTLMAGKDVG